MQTVLHNVTKKDVQSGPFPHIIIDNAISEEMADALIAAFPSVETLSKGADVGSNKRIDFTTKTVRGDETIPAIWKEFIDLHASSLFWEQFANLFEDHITAYYPTFAPNQKLSNLKTGVRTIDNYQNAQVLLDAHISANTPVTVASPPVRVVHVDDPRKIFAGLFYLRMKDDTSTGGDLELYEYKNQDYKFYGQHVDYKYVTKVKTVPYARNRLVLFLNSINSLHGVSVRNVTPFPRLFMNLIGEVEKPLFDISDRQEGKWRQRARRYLHI